MSWATEALGLPSDADARAIKRAYAKRLKTTRPDDDPAAFQQLYETYQAALAWAQTEAESETTTLPPCAGTRVEDANADVDTAPRLASTPRVEEAQVRPRSRPRAEAVRDPALEAELAQWQDDAYVQERATRILAAAQTLPAAKFGPWLRALPELWSFELRPRIGQAILSRVADDDTIMSDALFDALITCFSDEQDSEFRHALWTSRVLAVALGQSPDFLDHWLSQRVTTLSDDEHGAIGALVLRTLREQRASPQLGTIKALSKALRWSQFDYDQHDRLWLHDACKAARIQERMQRRLAALLPGSDSAALAEELEAAHWQKMTPRQAAALRACVVGSPSRWRCFLSALLPVRPMRMYRFCGIVEQWFPDGLPASLQPRHVRFWKQLGDPQRPHGWQLAINLTRGLAVAALVAICAILMLPFAGTASISLTFPVLATGLAIWSALVLAQMAARWQARTTLTGTGKRLAHCWALPAASAFVLTVMRSGTYGAAISAALAYAAVFRVTGRMEADSRTASMPMLTFVALGTPALIAAQAGAWPGTLFALLLWAISFIQDTQRQALQRQR
ncbi:MULTISPECIES: J domain-containing protein [Xanthomonas]|uniref:J domain-containing protein n=1 Tax=Xanthomonas rydalmerensis TaxID=3046274 RepID=A0ABZ0JQ66_9XANT|nr:MULTISPECIES: J domain-containing protein [unclassified Xanthomonas]MBB5874992.1 hypothetical protein [Xanthomonas sp. 3498]WOS41963.1 J domain-containing protein [Xanthomonas sp. DM-2023]WOS46149.1 J domain-containing protein [Xanthomonas sp. DM-2023]WOS50327.1 J domain-containing protein [Xanthomonas sp. DM-2023]WOS54507.1 J domain-containing protein [Xanthomonas sp. DM-2023]